MKKTTRIIPIILVIALGVSLMALFSGCGANRYRVDYNGVEYEGAKESYRAGATVKLRYPYVATDTDYSFWLDDDTVALDRTYKNDGFELRFVMPAHDVSLHMSSRNSMLPMQTAAPSQENLPAGTLLIDFFAEDVATADGGEWFELVLSTTDAPDTLRLDRYYRASADAEETCTSYAVPADVWEACFDRISFNGFCDWEDGGVSLDGVRLVCRFYDGGDYITVSTDSMPYEGAAAEIDEIRSILTLCLKDEYLIAG